MDGIKSKERVQQHGEVFTPDSIVNNMLDMVDKASKRETILCNKENVENLLHEVDKYVCTTYLEPSCGNGNFILRILDRKLQVLQVLPVEYWEVGLVKAVSSIYGVDIQGDNVRETKERVIKLIKNGTIDVLELPDREKAEFHFEKYNLSKELEDIITFILDKNIQHGDCLTGKKWSSNEHNTASDKETCENMLFTQYVWSGDNVLCKGHSLDDIKSDNDNDMFENGSISKHYKDIKLFNFEYNDILPDDEEF